MNLLTEFINFFNKININSYYMEIFTISLLLTSLFCIVVCPRLYVICTANSKKKYNYQIMKS